MAKAMKEVDRIHIENDLKPSQTSDNEDEGAVEEVHEEPPKKSKQSK